MISRRHFVHAGLGVGAGAVLSSFLASCAGVAGGGSSGGGKELQVAWWGGNDRAKRTQDVIDLFKKSDSSVKVSGQFSAWAGYWQKLDTEAAGGGLPDVIQMDMGYIGQYTKRQQCLDLTQMGDATLDLADFDKNQLAQGKVDGKLYGISLGGNIDAAFYNTTALTTAGAKVPADDTTWDGFASWCSKIAKSLPSGMYPADDPSGSTPPFEVWVRQRHDEMWTADGKLGYTVDDVKDWFTYWAELRKAKLIVPGTVAAEALQNGTNQGAPLVTEKAASSMTWSNFLGQYQILTKNELAMGRLPLGDQPGDYVKASQLWSASAKTEQTDTVAAFIKFFLHDEAAIKVLGLERGVPASAKARELLKPDLESYDKAQIDFFDTTSPKTRAKKVLEPATASDVGAAFTRAAQSISLTNKTPAEAAMTYMDEAQKALGA
ncbi:MAG TPA: hypothetical protein VIM10_16470 [Actinopolymorphaceae bacterium]